MNKLNGGTTVKMTDDEVRAWNKAREAKEKWDRENPAPPTEDERLAALENQLAGIVSAYREGVNNA